MSSRLQQRAPFERPRERYTLGTEEYAPRQTLECSICRKQAVESCNVCALLLCREHAEEQRHRKTCAELLVKMAFNNNNLSRGESTDIQDLKRKHEILEAIPELLNLIDNATSVAKTGNKQKGMELLKEAQTFSNRIFLDKNVTSAYLRVQIAELYLASMDTAYALQVCKEVLEEIPSESPRYIPLRGYASYTLGLAYAIEGNLQGAIVNMRRAYDTMSGIMLRSMPDRLFRIASSLSTLYALVGNADEALKLEKTAHLCADSCFTCGKISLGEWMCTVSNRLIVLCMNNDRSALLSVGKRAIAKYESSVRHINNGGQPLSKAPGVAVKLESYNGTPLGIISFVYIKFMISEASSGIMSVHDNLSDAQELLRTVENLYKAWKTTDVDDIKRCLECSLDRAKFLLSKAYERVNDPRNSTQYLQKAYSSACKYTDESGMEKAALLEVMQRCPPPHVFRALLLTQRADSAIHVNCRTMFNIPDCISTEDLCFGISRDIIVKYVQRLNKANVLTSSQNDIQKAFQGQRNISSQIRAKSASTRKITEQKTRRSILESVLQKNEYASGVKGGINYEDANGSVEPTITVSSFNIDGATGEQDEASGVLHPEESAVLGKSEDENAIHNASTSSMANHLQVLQALQKLGAQYEKWAPNKYSISKHVPLQPINTNSALAASARADVADKLKQRKMKEMESTIKPFEPMIKSRYELLELSKEVTLGKPRGEQSSKIPYQTDTSLSVTTRTVSTVSMENIARLSEIPPEMEKSIASAKKVLQATQMCIQSKRAEGKAYSQTSSELKKAQETSTLHPEELIDNLQDIQAENKHCCNCDYDYDDDDDDDDDDGEEILSRSRAVLKNLKRTLQQK